MTVSIAILSWNCREKLKACIDSVLRNPAAASQEIIVVDNGSADGTHEMLQKDYPMVVVLKNKHNRGVSGGRNQAMRQAKGRYILHLDSDIIVHPGSLFRLLAYMEEHPNVGLAGCKLLLPDGSVQYSCRRFPTVLSKISRRIRTHYGNRLLAIEDYTDRSHDGCWTVDYVVGACQLLRREVLDSVGFYDEHIFYGPEDIDYCRRVWAAGYSVDYVADATLTHDYRRITHRYPVSRMALRHAAGLVYYFWKWRHGHVANPSE